MKEYAIAPIYDIALFPFVRGVRRKILDICLENDYEQVLDVCCGTGDQLKLLRKNGFEVSGVDISEKMLEVSKKGSYAPSCRLEDAGNMSFERNSFDVAMTTFALHEKDRTTARRIIEEMVRVVKPGGHIMLADYRFDEETAWTAHTIIVSIERFAGGDHYRNFRSYSDFGGIPTLVEGLPLKLEHRVRVGMGSIAIDLFRLNT